jgi:hypothetical protein
MMHFTLYSYIGMLCAALSVAIACRPMPGRHALPRALPVVVLPATLAPLPVAAELWEPRACPDVDPEGQALTEALRLTGHPCYQWTARLAAMSWQSHHTLQRTYDMLAFATVATAAQRVMA